MYSIDWKCKDGEASIDTISVTYYQEADTCDEATGQWLRIFTEDGGGGPFICFDMPEGGRWSINSIDELIMLFEDFKKRAGLNEESKSEDSI